MPDAPGAAKEQGAIEKGGSMAEARQIRLTVTGMT